MQGFRHSSNTLTFVLPDAPHMTGPTCLDACTLDSLRIFHLFRPSSAQVEVIPKRRLIITSPKGQVEDSPRPLPRRTATTDQWEVEGEQRSGFSLPSSASLLGVRTCGRFARLETGGLRFAASKPIWSSDFSITFQHFSLSFFLNVWYVTSLVSGKLGILGNRDLTVLSRDVSMGRKLVHLIFLVSFDSSYYCICFIF